MGYAVRIEAFEGPLDLLLFLIRKNEVEIHDIPIAHITRQYLDYIEVMQLLDLEMAGDMLVMAATLMQIKARMLLPSQVLEDEEDPRLELVRQLEEYQVFRKAAETLAEREETFTKYYLRGSGPGPVDLPEPDEVVLDVTLFDMLKAYQEALERIQDEGRYQVHGPEVKVADQVEFLRELLKGSERLKLVDILVKFDNRLVMVVTIVAILELARLGELAIEQSELYGDLWLNRKTPAINFQSGML
ncbi:segregation and condensation protein A [Candidatus Zixiibacteriota bacterium]